jgi:uncharacterized protein YuzE
MAAGMVDVSFTLSRHAKAMLAERGIELKIDRENDSLYLRLDDSKIVESEEAEPGVVLDFDANEKVVGIEILRLSTRVAQDDLQRVFLETA